ncbi:mechanosensitive ion channel family protein [Oscillatoria sp. CS-180]|uniref:mechanosensitive ion channel family protein n=1 Tax=Oscillatoria sp. CS-180 TaxID=3021720 RepID=UPI00232BA5D3|nr:mechanosensitive ion channel family protein [Oscillatoria sp. CS-180]MDB9524721.1 mechanosensitive ion channel family protein [Oscillatoria sp. CS-180]
MSALLETIKESLLNLVSGAIEILPAVILAIIVLIATPYTVRPARKLTRVVVEKLTPNFSLQLLSVKVASVTVWVAGVLLACILIFPDLGLGDIVALLGLSSVAVGFAFQDIFKNFLAGILLLLNQPFKVNDQVIVSDYEGTVESIDIRSTKIRNYQGERIVIPNSLVFTNPIEVLTENASRRTDLAIGLDYNTPLSEARQILHKAASRVDTVLSDPAVEVDIVEFGGSSIDFIVRYWTRPPQAIVRRTRTQVIMSLKAACDEAGLSIPYPIRSVYYFDQKNFDDATPRQQSDSELSHNGSGSFESSRL